MSARTEHADPAAPAPSSERAEKAVARMREMSPDLRGCAVLGLGGEALAATGDVDRWQQPAAVLLGAADLAGDEPAERLHVATEEGEVFAVRCRGLAMVAVTERFTLASLMMFDMRTLLRDLADSQDPGQPRSQTWRPDG